MQKYLPNGMWYSNVLNNTIFERHTFEISAATKGVVRMQEYINGMENILLMLAIFITFIV